MAAMSNEIFTSGDGLAMDSEDASMKHHEQLRNILFGSLRFKFLPPVCYSACSCASTQSAANLPD
jgi:hypothetical protein